MYSYSTGVLSRNPADKYLRLSFNNISDALELVNYSVFNWDTGSPVLAYQSSLYLNALESQLIYLELVNLSYEIFEINSFEVQLTLPSNNSIITNIFTVSSNNV